MPVRMARRGRVYRRGLRARRGGDARALRRARGGRPRGARGCIRRTRAAATPGEGLARWRAVGGRVPAEPLAKRALGCDLPGCRGRHRVGAGGAMLASDFSSWTGASVPTLGRRGSRARYRRRALALGNSRGDPQAAYEVARCDDGTIARSVAVIGNIAHGDGPYDSISATCSSPRRARRTSGVLPPTTRGAARALREVERDGEEGGRNGDRPYMRRVQRLD